MYSSTNVVIFSLTIAFLYGLAVSMKLALGRRPTILFTYALLIIFFTSMWHPKLHHWDLRQYKGVKTFLIHFKLLCVIISIMISFQPSRGAHRTIKFVSAQSTIPLVLVSLHGHLITFWKIYSWILVTNKKPLIICVFIFPCQQANGATVLST